MNGLGLVLLGALACTVLGASNSNPAVPQIEASLRLAIEDTLDGAAFKTPGWTSGPLDDASVVAIHATLVGRLRSHMTGGALRSWSAALDAAIDRERDGQHVVITSGGVAELEIEQLDVSGDRATVSARSLDWIRSTTLGSRFVASPAAWDGVSATLLRVDGSWLVSELSLQPERSGP